MKHVTIYTSPTCHFCHQAMDYLKEKNVEFEAKDISKDPEARKFVHRTNRLFPVLVFCS